MIGRYSDIDFSVGEDAFRSVGPYLQVVAAVNSAARLVLASAAFALWLAPDRSAKYSVEERVIDLAGPIPLCSIR